MGRGTNKHITHGGVHCTTSILLHTLTACFSSQLVCLISHKRENRSHLLFYYSDLARIAQLVGFVYVHVCVTTGTAEIFKAARQWVTKNTVQTEGTTKQIWQSLQSQMQSLLTRFLTSEVLNLKYIITAINKGGHIIQ